MTSDTRENQNTKEWKIKEIRSSSGKPNRRSEVRELSRKERPELVQEPLFKSLHSQGNSLVFRVFPRYFSWGQEGLTILGVLDGFPWLLPKHQGMEDQGCEVYYRHRPPGPHPRIRLALPTSGVDLASVRH